MQIQKWVSLLLGRWGVLAAGALAGALLGLLAAARTPPVYEAHSTILLTPPSDRSGMFTAPGVRAIVKNQTIGSGVVGELGLNAAPHGVTAQSFLAEALTIEEIPNTNLFHVKVRLGDPQLAASAATRVAERAVELMSRLWQETAAGRQTQLERQVEQARLAFADAEQRLETYLQRPEGRAAARRFTADGSASRSARGRTGLRDAGDAELAQLETEVEVRRRVYIDVGARHEQARIELASTTPPLRLVDRAAVPDQPLPGGRRRTIVLGLLAGLVLAGCFVVAREWRISPAPPSSGRAEH